MSSLVNSTESRFMSHVYKTKLGCWLWNGGRVAQGRYGKFRYKGRIWQAHRVAYDLFTGPVDDALVVLHNCDNPMCVNPGHLILGTHQENSLDMGDKGRHSNTSKTHCPRGHEYTAGNTYTANRPNGRVARVCKACTNIKNLNRHHLRAGRPDLVRPLPPAQPNG